MKKTVLITGGTGGIGGACLDLLHKNGWEIYAPVRNIKTADRLLELPHVYVEEIDFTNQQKLNDYCIRLMKHIPSLTLVALLAGGRGPNKEFFDEDFPGSSKEEKVRNAIEGHKEASVLTKKRMLSAIVHSYRPVLKDTVLATVGSHAADFSDELALEYDEIGYATSMKGVREVVADYKQYFGSVVFHEPGLVRTGLTKDKLAFALNDPKNKKQEADEYALEFLTKTGLL